MVRRGNIIYMTQHPEPLVPRMTVQPEPLVPRMTVQPDPDVPRMTSHPEPEVPRDEEVSWVLSLLLSDGILMLRVLRV